MRTFVLLCTVLLLAVATTHGEIYKWTDANGKIHFTDTLAAVPPAYRDQVEARRSTPAASKPAAPGPETPASPPSSPVSYRVPLYGKGHNLFVEARLNDDVNTRLQVDTGATYTVISRGLAQRLRLDLSQADIIPIVTANGTVLASLTRLASISVGEVTVENLDVIVHDTGGDGLLGMSFLSNFQVAFNPRERELVLTRLDGAQGTTSYGGRSEAWWRYQFAFYRNTITNIEVYLRDRPLSKPDRARLEKAHRLFQQKLVALEHKASRVAVPRHWRY